MAFSNFEQNVLKSSSSSASTKKKDEETKAPSGGFSNFSKAMNLEMVPVVEKKPTEQVDRQRELDKYGLPKSTLSRQTDDAIPYEDIKKESFWTRAAKFVLPKKAEDFFGLNKSEAYKDVTKSFENAYATTDLKKLIEKVDPETGKLAKQTAGELYNETPVDQYMPFISTIRQISEATKIYQSAKRLESGGNTPVDDLRLANFKLESERDKTFGAKVVNIITQLPAFAGELALTGGIFKVGKIATEKAATKVLTTQAKKTALRNTTERILTKSLGNIAGATLQTVPARIGEITAGTIKNMTPTYSYTSDNELKQFEAFIDQEGDDLWKAAAISFTDQWVEVVSEHSGGIFNEVLNPIAKPVKNKLMKVAIFNSFLKNNPSVTSNQFMKLVKSAGWDGVLAEMGEERIGDAMHAMLYEAGLGGGGNEAFSFPTKEELAVELVAFSVPGVMINIANKGLGAGEDGSFKRADKEEVENDFESQLIEIATEAEQVISARNMSIVGNGQINGNNQQYVDMQTQLRDYENESKKQQVYITNEQTNLPIANIETVQYPDGKIASSINAGTEQNSITRPFTQGKLFDTEEQAVEEAKKEITGWVKDTINSQVETEEAQSLQNIADRVNNKIKEDFKETTSETVMQDKDIIKEEVKREAPKVRESKDEKDKRLEQEANSERIANFTDTEKKEVAKYHNHFKRMFEIYDDVIDEDDSLMVGEAQEQAMERYAKETDLTQKEQDFILDQIQYMGEGYTESIDRFSEYAVKTKMIDDIISKAKTPKLIEKNASLDEVSNRFLGKPTQKATVEEAVKEKPKSIKEVSKEVTKPRVENALKISEEVDLEKEQKQIQEDLKKITERLSGKNQYNRKDWIDNYRKTTLPEFNLAERLKKLDVFVDKIKEITEESDKEAFDRGIRFVAEITYPFSMGERGFGYEFEYKTKPNTNDIVKDTIEFYKEEIKRLDSRTNTYYENKAIDIINKIIGTESKEVEVVAKETDIKVGDTFNTNGVTNMESPVTVTSIEGRTIKFKDATGTEFQGLDNKLIRTFLEDGSWTRAGKDYADQLAEMTKAGEHGSLFLATEITKKNIRDTITGKPAPSGVLLGERKLYINREALNKDIEILKSDDPIAIKEADLQEHARKYNENNTDLAQRYLDSIISFEENHIKNGTIEEAYSLFEGGEQAKETSKSMDQRAIKNELAKEIAKKTFYHGTTKNFDEFSMDRVGENTEWDNAKFGIFFIDNKNIAYDFANDNRAAGDTNDVIVKEVKLDIKNPIDLTLTGILNKEEQAPVIVKILQGEDMSPAEALELLNDTIDLGTVSELYEGLYNDIGNKKIMQDAGYDGIISQFGEDILEYVVFDTNQIKYATIDNTGGSNIIESYDNIQQKGISTVSQVPDRESRLSSQEPPVEIPRYDQASMLVESGNGLGENGTNGLTKKERQLINEQVESLLESKDFSIYQDDYTLADRELMAAYTGAGGKESVGGEGAGLLSEYYTPQIVIDKLWQIAGRLMPNAETAFEPSAGIGKIINSSPADITVDGAEISKVSGTIATILNPDSNITIGDFQELFFDTKTNKKKTPKQYDILIGNPPFGERAGFIKGKGEESKINRLEEYFIKRGLDMTKEGGYLIYVVNSSFLQKKTSAGKQAIAELGTLVEAYRLPENSFEDTSIGTDIVVFKKDTLSDAEINVQDITEDKYFVANPFNILGEIKTRKNRFGKTEEYVVGDLDESINKVRVSKRTEEQNAPIPYEQYRLTGENSIMEGKSWEEARIKHAKEQAKSEQKEKITKKTEKKQVARKADSQTTLPKKNSAKLVIPEQNISNKDKVNNKEVEMLRRIERNMSIPEPSNEEKKFLNYENGKYYPDAIYFSGDIYDKIDYLKANKQNIIEAVGEDKYNKQLVGLEAIKPKRVTLKDITFDPLDRHVANLPTTFEKYSQMTDGNVLQGFTYYISANRVALSPRVQSYDVSRYVRGEQASKDTKPIMGLIKADAKRLFNHYLKTELNQETQKILEDKYNKEKNSYVKPDYSKIPVNILDMAKDFRGRKFIMSQTQKEGVGFLVNKGSGAIAYGVGVGKTHTLAIATKANLDKGWTKRPLFVVPKSTISKTWINTLHAMFPTLTINNLEGLQAPIVRKLKKERGDNPKDWIRDGELTIISHDGVLRLGFKEDELRSAAGDLEDALWTDPSTKRGAEKSKEKYDEILGNAQKYVTDIMLSDLGFDHISVDEVHNFRKIFQGAKPEKTDEDGKQVGKKRFGNVIGGTPSKRAQQLFLMTQYIQKNNGNRNVFLASATPFENHATEVYNILSLVARDRMKQMGILNINDFFSTFANFEVELDRKLNGEWLNREKMKSFSNLPALQSLIKEFIDYQEDPTLVRPDRRVITPTLQMSDKQIENLAKIQNLLNGTSNEEDTDGLSKKDVEDGAFLKASTYSIANSVSPYFIKEYAGEIESIEKLIEESPKIQYTLEAIKTLKADKKTKDYGSFVFFGKMGVEYHPALAEYFAKYLGYKKSEVAYISGKVTDDQKEVIKEKFNTGEIKVLIGGDQTKEGIDLQNNGYATFNLALGWNPTQIQQVEGRVWRQGNNRNIAPLVYPLVENSGDAMIYNKFEEKGGRINDLFSYAGNMFDVGEIDPAEKKLSLLTDPQDKARMQIEIDKVALYNERVMIDNDLKDLIKLQSDINDAKGNVEYYTRELKEEDISDDRKKQYKKELKRYNDKLERINEKLKARKITDLEAKIDNFQKDIDNIDEKIKKINETLPLVLEKFTKEYQEQLKLRKTLSEHMEEIKGLIAETKERTQDEIDELKRKKIEEVEAKRLEVPEEISYQGGGSNASIGLFRDGTPVELGHLDTIKPIEMPELVRLARELTGSTPKVKAKLRNKLGLFKPKTGEIYLKADQFVQGNEEQLAKLLAHEIGHVTDWLPDKSMARGNLLGRIFTLRKFMANTFDVETGAPIDTDEMRKQAMREVIKETNTKYGDYLTQSSIRAKLKPLIQARYNRFIDESGAIRNSKVKSELQALSEYWRPYDKDNSSSNFIKYRNSSAELYADAISVLFNSPGTLERMAPTFYTEFFEALDNKPDFKASFFELQELLHGSTEEIFKARKESIRTGFAKAEAIQAEFAAKKKLGGKSFFYKLRQQLDDINFPIIKKVREAEANGVILDENENPRFLLQEESFIDNENFLLVEDLDANVVKPIEKAGMVIEDIGEYLLLKRIQNERADIANPYGFNKDNSTAQLDFLKTNVGESNYNLLEKAAQHFHDLVYKSVEEAVKVGSYNAETFETKIKPNKDSYASFQVVDYMEDYMPATIKQQIGTLKEVSNPFVSTILKTIALNRLNAHQRAKNGTIKLLQENFPEDITESKRITSDGKLTVFRPARDRGGLEVLENGKINSYDVDPYIAKSFNNDKVGDLNAMVVLLDKFNNKLFKPIVTTYNLGFAAAFNPIRDFKRNYKNIKNATVFGLLKAYVKSLPSAVRYSKGQLDEFTKSLVESKAMVAPINDYNFDAKEDELGRIMQRYGLLKKDMPVTNRSIRIARKTILKPITMLLEGIRFTANTLEIVSKVAGAKVRMAGGESGKQLAYNLRNYTGTPNWKTKGANTRTTNALFIFSNIMKEGLKSDYQIATNPKTRSGYWWKTVKIDILPKLLMFLAGAGLLGDLLKEFFDDISEYDKTNYIILPLGWYYVDEDKVGFLNTGEKDIAGRKAVYARIPHDETGRLLAAVFWKMTNMVKDKGNTKDLQGIFDFGAGQLPSLTPILTIGGGWIQYLSGKNPYDEFRGRPVIDDTTFAAGGAPAMKKMVQWTTNSLGLTKFATFDRSKQSTFETTMQVTPFLSSVFKISNYGQQERLYEISDEIKRDRARQSLDDRDLINKYVLQARADKSTIFAATKYRNDLIMESLGGRMPQSKEEAEAADKLMAKFKRSLKRGLNDDPRVNAIISTSSNQEKKALLEQIRADMNDAEFNKFRQGLIEDKIVSPEVAFSIK